VGVEKLDPRIERTRKAVLEAALEVAARVGFTAATVEAIAAESDVARSTIYRHWPDIAAIFGDALEGEAATNPAVDTGTLRGDLVQLMTMFCDILATGIYGRLLPHLISAAASDPAFARAQATYTATRRETLTAVLDRAVERGEAPRDLDFTWVQDVLFAPVLVRHLVSHEPLDPEWALGHIDRTLPLLTDKEHQQ
jgi:AcrR family transcriptional regulator